MVIGTQQWQYLHTSTGHSCWFGGVRLVAISPNSQTLVSGSDDNIIGLPSATTLLQPLFNCAKINTTVLNLRGDQLEQMSQEQSEKIEAQLQQAQQERAQIHSLLEQIQDKLSQVLSLVKPLLWVQFFDPSILQSQLSEIQDQLQEAQRQRSQLQSLVSEMPLRLEKSNQEILQDVATRLSQLLREQLSEVQTQFQQAQQEQKQLQSLLSELPSQVSQLVKAELEKAQPQTTPPPTVIPTPVRGLVPPDDPWSTTPSSAPAPPRSVSATSKPARSNQDELISVRGLNYTTLRDLLAVGKWKEADRETKFVMFKVSGLEQEGKLDKEHLENFPYEDMCTIDQLWVKCSNGRFGFSAQKRIFESVGGKPGVNDYLAYCRFGERIGWLISNCWLSESDLTFTLNAPCGHLPVAPFLTLIRGIRSRKLYFLDFFSRIKTCKM